MVEKIYNNHNQKHKISLFQNCIKQNFLFERFFDVEFPGLASGLASAFGFLLLQDTISASRIISIRIDLNLEGSSSISLWFPPAAIEHQSHGGMSGQSNIERRGRH